MIWTEYMKVIVVQHMFEKSMFTKVLFLSLPNLSYQMTE